MVEYARTARSTWHAGDPSRFPANTLFRPGPLRIRGRGSRCREVFDPPESVTLWQLPEAVEEEFEAHWERWLDQADEWKPFFLELEALKETELKTALQSFDLDHRRRIRAVLTTAPLG